jgi:hypothetical protein
MRTHVLPSLLTILVVSAVAAGCGNRSGTRVNAGSPSANLRVINSSNDAITVFVDGADLGSVARGDLEDFDVRTGARDVHFREAGESFRRFQGAFNIQDAGSPGAQRIDLTYQPGVSRNFTVRNEDFDDIIVRVDGQEIGLVRAFEASDFLVVAGTRQVEFREDSTVGQIDAGTWTFAAPSPGAPEVELIYDP